MRGGGGGVGSTGGSSGSTGGRGGSSASSGSTGGTSCEVAWKARPAKSNAAWRFIGISKFVHFSVVWWRAFSL